MIKWLPLILILIAFALIGCKTLQQDKRCRLIPQAGPCNDSIIKYYYDRAEAKCKPFNWGGCHGLVPFDFIEECEACATTQ